MTEQVKRYVTTCDCMSEAAWGDYVRFSDHSDAVTALHQQIEGLQRQVAELTNQRDAILLQARCWAGEAKAQQAITKAVGEALGGVPNWGPIAAGVEALRKRARTAEREAAKALRTLKGLEKVARVVDANSDQVCGENNRLRAELEAARGLLRELQERLDPHRDAVAWGKVCAFLTATPAPEVRPCPSIASVPDPGDAFYAGLYKKSASMWKRLHDLAVSKGYDHVQFAIECAPVYKCDCMGARKMSIDLEGNTIPCECVAAANEAEQGDRQEAVAVVGAVIDRKRKVFSIDILDAAALHPRTKLYTTPQPAPDVSALVEALERIADTDPDDGSAWFQEVADKALATYHKETKS